ncbi:MAG: glycosyltransferase [Verrucomicrobiae bacterium]|nr:glycosyltransferase [Verrucomicrobiae bacterium]NNJ87673.1 glycosyltransferase [Akkermansiaceae bacterium]
MMLIIPILALLCAPALWVVLGRPRFLPEPTKAASPCDISIIIPARNEATNIKQLLDSIRRQSHQPKETIVVNDGSTDDTAEIARTMGATVINAKPLPDGWNGKPWACQQGASAATGSWFLFLDADLDLRDGAVGSLLQLCTQPDKVYSVCPHHRIKKMYEQLSAFFNVLMLAGSSAFGVNKQASGKTALFGQCLLINSDHYQQVGGHESVKDKVLENFHLAEILKSLGIKRECFMGRHLIEMRMHPLGLSELWASWQKGFSDGAANTAPRVLVYSSIWISGMILTIVSAIVAWTSYSSSPFIILTAIAYLSHALFCLWVFRLAGNFSVWNALLFPLSFTFYQVLFFYSIINKKRGRTTQWKGRAVN